MNLIDLGRMNKFLKISCLLLLLFCFTSSTFAEEEKQELISRTIPVNFIPEKAILLVTYQDGSVMQYRALLIPPMKNAEMDINLPDWMVGTFVRAPSGNTPVRYSIFLKGKQNENALVSGIEIDNSSPPYVNSVELMKEQIGIRKKISESLQVQHNAQAASLKRLRADAEVIANLSRIVEIVEETEIVKSEIENIEKDLELLRSTFQAVKSMPQPKNYLRREIDLTKQSDDLIKLVNATESDEESRKSLSQSDIQTKLSLIEQTRFEDEDKLKQQLIRLKSGANPAEKPPQNGEAGQVKNYWEIQ